MRVIRCPAPPIRSTPSIPSTGSTLQTCPGNHLYHGAKPPTRNSPSPRTPPQVTYVTPLAAGARHLIQTALPWLRAHGGAHSQRWDPVMRLCGRSQTDRGLQCLDVRAVAERPNRSGGDSHGGKRSPARLRDGATMTRYWKEARPAYSSTTSAKRIDGRTHVRRGTSAWRGSRPLRALTR